MRAEPAAAWVAEVLMMALDSMAQTSKHQQGERVCGSGAQRRWPCDGAARMPPSGGTVATVAARWQWRGERGPSRPSDLGYDLGSQNLPRIGMGAARTSTRTLGARLRYRVASEPHLHAAARRRGGGTRTAATRAILSAARAPTRRTRCACSSRSDIELSSIYYTVIIFN